MVEYWESRFKSEGPMWDFFPSDSAIKASDIFRSGGLKHILIPGFGYGRNARLFIEKGFEVTGIEISGSAIELAKANGINCIVYHGSVTTMPFDHNKYDGIFCYALIHLLNKHERKAFLKSCFTQLKDNGIMIFVVACVQSGMYGNGKYLSKDRFEVLKGLKVFFYDLKSVTEEFSAYGMVECTEIEEPVKFMEGQEPVKLLFVQCRKDSGTENRT